MKRFYLLSILSLIMLALIFRCSSKEEDTTLPPSILATPEPEPPAPKQYILTVTAGEGGKVSTEGGTYDEGTSITITATPNEGYEFVGWVGSDSTDNSLTINLNSNQTISAIFQSLDLPENLLNFYNENGGRNSFNETQILALEALILGLNNLQLGN